MLPVIVAQIAWVGGGGHPALMKFRAALAVVLQRAVRGGARSPGDGAQVPRGRGEQLNGFLGLGSFLNSSD